MKPASDARPRVPSGWAETLAWSAVSFALSLLSSAVGGRALWCDEILRITGQHYSIPDLLAFRHLHDFCTQTPAAYLFTRPFQLLLGYEFGGCLVSAAAAAVVAAAAIRTMRRLLGGAMPSRIASFVAATNPLLVFYGGELGFYEMWSAAFACAFALLAAWREDDGRPVRRLVRGALLALSGTLFVAFHFAGLFVWAVVAAAMALHEAVRRGVTRVWTLGVPLAVPALVNLPMYVGAQDKAVHLGSKAIVWSKAAGIPSGLARYVGTLFPSFTGGSVVGVGLCLAGVWLLWRRRERRALLLFASSVFAVLLFLSYSGLRDYMPNVARYWVYALAPVLALTGLGVEACVAAARSRRSARALWALPAAVAAANALADAALVQMEGRVEPFAKFRDVLRNEAAGRNGLLYPNHYEARFLGGYYALPSTAEAPCAPVIPAYWEQGPETIVEGMRAARALSPLLPCYVTTPQQFEWARQSGCDTTNAVFESRPATLRWTVRLHLFPEVLAVKDFLSRILVPTVDEAVARAEASGRPLAVPGAAWGMRTMPPKAAGRPFVPILVAQPGANASVRAYLPSSWSPGKRAALVLQIASERESAAVVPGAGERTPATIRLSPSFRPVRIPLADAAPGRWTEVSVVPSDAPCALLSAVVAAE